MLKWLRKTDQQLETVTGWILLTAVAMMFTLCVLNIVLRWMNTTLHWVEPFVRHLVLLSAFLGGVVATGRGTHIGIDILGKWCETHKKEFMRLLIMRIIALSSVVTNIWLIKASVDFMKVELEFGKAVFWGITSGYLVGIIPFGFFLIALRFSVIFILSFERHAKTANHGGNA